MTVKQIEYFDLVHGLFEVMGTMDDTDECMSDGRPHEYLTKINDLIREMGVAQFTEVGRYIDASKWYVSVTNECLREEREGKMEGACKS